MTTENDDILDLEANIGKSIYDLGVYPVGYQDPSGVYPLSQYYYESSINKASRGLTRNSLSTNGGIPSLQTERLKKYVKNPRYVAPNPTTSDADPVGITSEGIPTGAITGEPVFNYVPPEEDDKRTRSQYPRNQVWETPGGHIVELDDTLTNERILIKHRSGAGIEIKPDGSVFVSSTSDVLISAGNDQHVVVEGNAHMTYQGDLNVDVAGDYNLSVGGNKLQIITGDHISEIDGARKGNIALQDNLVVKGHQYNTVVESKTDLNLGGYRQAVKGNFEQSVEGDMGIFSSGAQQITSEVRQNMTSPDTNIHATNLSVFGDEGTFGGENIVAYFYNIHLGHTLWAGDGEGGAGTINVDTIRVSDIVADNNITSPTFLGDVVGDLQGTAAAAVSANTAVAITGSPGHSVSATNNASDPIADDIKATVLPNAGVATTYQKSEYGIRDVQVDPEGELKRLINQTSLSGNVSDRPLTTGEVRSKLRDENNKNNEEFTAKQVAEGKLNPEALGGKSVPSETGRTASDEPTVAENYKIIGDTGNFSEIPNISGNYNYYNTYFTPNPGTKSQILPDPLYNPNNAASITSGTKLARGITIGKFLGAAGEKTNMNHITDATERLQIARQLYLQAVALNTVNTNMGKFSNKRAIVVEGLYKKGPLEFVAPNSLNDLASEGRAVVYQLINEAGVPDNASTYDLAVYWKDTVLFERLILDYDRYHPDGSLACHVVLVMPEVDSSFTGKFNKNLETRLNGSIQTSGELVEILA